MIVVDASALVAIVLHEEDREDLLERLMRAPSAVMSPVNLWEVLQRLAEKGDDGPSEAIALIELLRI